MFCNVMRFGSNIGATEITRFLGCDTVSVDQKFNAENGDSMFI